MKKYYLTITYIIFLGLISCSNEETKTQSEVAARPSVPVMVGEVQIGNQILKTENLNTSRYRNGDLIPHVTDREQWRNSTTGAWCYYNNDPANGPIYGKLYNWYAVIDPRGLAPSGWHIPTQTEFQTLITYLGGSVVAGGKLKSRTGWQSPNDGATNITGFTALPGGNRWYNNFLTGGSSAMGTKGSFWSATTVGNTYAYRLDLFEYSPAAPMIQGYRNSGCSVRCIKD